MELITGSYKALEEAFLKHFAEIKRNPLEKVLIITQSKRLNQRLKEKLLSSKECLSCVFWQDILGLVSGINRAGKNYIPLKQKRALDYFKLKDFLERYNFNSSFGYIEALQSSFMDMQNALIMPQDLLKIEEFDSSLSSKELKDLIFIYQNYLKLNSESGKLSYKDFFTSALDNIEQNKYLSQFKQIIFYGIYDLTNLQYDILKAVSQNYPTAVFFPYEDIASYKYLQDFYLTDIVGLNAKHLQVSSPKGALELFASHLFEVPKEQEQKKYDAPIKIVDTSGTLGQIEAAAKEVLLLHKQGFDFKDIAVCARSLEPYKNDLIRVFNQNFIPINLNYEESFLTQPLIGVCVSLLNIVRNNFHKDSVLSFISSPYLKNRQPEWGQIIKDIGVQTGFNQWLNLLDLAIEKGQKEALSLKVFLMELEKKVSLLESCASFNYLVLCVKDILNTFIAKEILTPEEQKLLNQFEGVLEELSSFDKVRNANKEEFLEELNYLLQQEKINIAVNLQDALTIADIMSLRGQNFKAVIMLGLNEGVLPAKVSEDPVFKDIWRLTLQKLGYNIKISAQRYYEEKLFFYLALSSAAQKAILIYQRCDSEGKLQIPSIYLNWVLRFLNKAETFSLSRRPAKQLLEWYKISPDLLNLKEASFLAALEGNYALAANLTKGEEELFLSAFSLNLQGPLGARDLVCKPRNELWKHIAKSGLSPSSARNLYQCPAKYLFDKILTREDLSVLQRDKLDSRDKGILSHKILEQFYNYLIQRNLFDKVFSEGALNILQTFIEKNLNLTDYKKYGLYPLLWFVLCKEIEQKLKTFVKKDLTKMQEEKRKPVYFEQNISCSLGEFKIHGQIDRIDLSAEESFSVVDYKSGDIAGTYNKLIFEEGHFQGPFYFELAQNFEKLKNIKPSKMVYASLKNDSFNEISYENYLTFKDTFWTLIKFLKELVEEGLFIITPSKKSCQYCLYGDICRKNHAPSQRRANFSKQAAKLRELVK